MVRLGLATFCLLAWWVSSVAAEDEKSQPPKTQTPKETGQKAAGDSPDADKPEANEADVTAGHSYHGEVFNEGPRQQAYLMKGTGHVRFPVTTSSEQAQAFVSQGLGQIYGFWYLEAERSFRQAAAIDPECAMAYWGAALANSRSAKRSQGFMAEAVKRKDKVTPRERMYIEAFDKYVKAGSKNKQRGQTYARDLEKLLYEYPDDVEAKALLALQLYLNRSSGSKISSYLAVDALLGEVFAVEPLHSAHHFRIHLWDHEKPERALQAAALCGKGSPGIAHMWHMPGHIYSRLKRYNEAVWQQEASARTDHAHMMRDRVMPDEIHNFAHNNEWLIRNLIFVGRARDGLDLAKNMTELPQHPKYNTLARRGGSASYGRRRLIGVLQQYELWPETLEACNLPHLAKTGDFRMDQERLRLLGEAYYGLAKTDTGDQLLQSVETQLAEVRGRQEAAVRQARDKLLREKAPHLALQDAKQRPLPPWEGAEQAPPKLTDALKKQLAKAESGAKRATSSEIRELEKTQRTLRGWQLAAAGKQTEALVELRKAGGVSADKLARLQFHAGEQDQALAAIDKSVGQHRNEVLPLACQVELLWTAGKQDLAREKFEQLRTVAAKLDLDTKVAQRLAPIAKALGHAGDWRAPFVVGGDFGERPLLDSLGPFRWQPTPAPSWRLAGADGKQRSGEDYKGRPVVMIFYLGYGCLHCVEQLHKFAPMKDKFAEAGIDMVAISSDDMEGLKISIDGYDKGKLPIPLVADPELAVFKKYRAYDDFENLTLHGTFLVDPQGRVRWQDISYEPFMDAEFLLKESKRLLAAEPATASLPPSAID